MIHFISGKPGGGKSLYAVYLIIWELVYGRRVVVTNVPLKLGELNEYIQREHPGRVVDVVGRVVLLAEDEVREFWCIRPGWRGRVLSKEEWKSNKRPDYSGVIDGGVMYVIDEIHNYFSARQWAQTGQDALFYVSQHRHLGDTVVCVTQAIQNVDAQFRSVTQDFTYLRNLSKERLGLFRLPAYFRRATYTSPATDTAQPVETGYFRLDVAGVAGCYDTSVGVSMHSRVADRGERSRGAHWGYAVVVTVCVLVGIFFGVPRLVARAFSPSAPKVSSVSQQRPLPGVNVTDVRTVREVRPVTPTNSVSRTVTGFSCFDGKQFVTYSDGSTAVYSVTNGALLSFSTGPLISYDPRRSR